MKTIQGLKGKCTRCGRQSKLTRHHLLTRNEAIKMEEERLGKNRRYIKHLIKKINKLRRMYGTVLVCVNCHKKIHNSQ